MITTTDLLLGHEGRDGFAEALRLGYEGDLTHVQLAHAAAEKMQHAIGLAGGSRRLLSPPEHQHKLSMAEVPSFGLTLYHETMKTNRGIVINSCPSSGDCRRLCVVENSFGGLPSVQSAWRWRTNLLVEQPFDFFVMLGHDIRSAIEEHRKILVRLNVNSDIEWHRVVPELVDGSIIDTHCCFYDYTKNETILDSRSGGWVTSNYRVAYSWNEASHWHADAVTCWLLRGGPVAVVTDRRRGQPVSSDTVHGALPFSVTDGVPVLDADKGDEWMFEPGPSIGDLSLKPRTRELREFGETSDFVVSAYHPRLEFS